MMESFKSKYIQTCQQQKARPNDSLLHAIEESSKKNKTSDTEYCLDFSGCNLSVGDCNILSKCFATDNCIEEYHFTDCLLSEDSLKIILNALSFNKSIRILDMKGNNLRASGAELIGKILKRVPLSELYLEWNSLGMWDSGIVAISEGLALNQTLRVLDLSNNKITHEGGKELANGLKRNKQLRILDMRWNNVGIAGGRAFLSALAHNKYIVSLELAGNNIPSDIMKAIATALQRNVEYRSLFDEQQARTKSMREEIDQLHLEKSMQVSTLMDQLEREKEIHNNLNETTRDRLEQMRSAIEDLKTENKKLKEKKKEQEHEIEIANTKLNEVTQIHEALKLEAEENRTKHHKETSTLKELNSNDKKVFQGLLDKKEDEIRELEKEKKELMSQLQTQSSESAHLKDVIKRNEQHFEIEKNNLQDRLCRDNEEQKAEFTNQIRVLNSRITSYENDKQRLEEEIGRLKSNNMNDKLRHEEDLLNQRTKWKQEEILKSKQYEDRIDLLINVKEELQAKVSRSTVEQSELHTQFVSVQKELETYKRQNEQQQQLMNQRDLEYRNESNRLKLDIDSEKRVTAELKDKIQRLELKNQEVKSQFKELKSEAETEKNKLLQDIKCKEDEIRRIRDDEMRRASVLESALQSYISSARSAYKS